MPGKPGRPRQRPDQVLADRGYDHDKYRRQLWARGVKPGIARRGTDHGSDLGRWRWVASAPSPGCTTSAACAWERDPVVHTAFLTLGCAAICWRYLTQF